MRYFEIIAEEDVTEKLVTPSKPKKTDRFQVKPPKQSRSQSGTTSRWQTPPAKPKSPAT